MHRYITTFLLLSFLASCGSNYSSAPSNLDNACKILQQNPDFARAFSTAERRWGVPPAVMMAMMYQESKFVANARTPFRYVAGVIPMGRQSSAYGYSQALDGTWDEYRASAGRRSARRDNIRDATDFMGWYMNQTQDRNGIPLNDTRKQYLAYHEGHTGYARGTYRRKAWLMRVSNELAQRARTYQSQLNSCLI